MATLKQRCIFPSLPRTTRGKFTVLGSDPKGKNFLYCNGNNVFIRDINDPAKSDIYTDHSAKPTVAAYSPSGFYICSGDVTGKVRVWDTVNPEHILKNEYGVIGGEIKDIAWDAESKRLGICGEGRQFYAKCITMDSGNSCGELSGHHKSINSIAFKPTRPYRMATASEDFAVQTYEGPPFKYKKNILDHSNFVNCVRYHPAGDVFITGGADGKALVFDGKSSDFIGALGEDKAHKGGIYALAFSPDGNEVLTISGDKTAKIWDVKTRQNVVTFEMGKEINDMQVGCLWQGDNIVTVSLSGYINYLDRDNPSVPKRVQKGHNKAIACLAVSPDQSSVYSGAIDGQIYVWNANVGSCELVAGTGHSNQVSDMVITDRYVVTIGMDDTCRYIDISKNEFDSKFCKLPSQPLKLSTFPNGAVAISCVNHVVGVEDGNIVFQQEVKWEPKCVSVSPSGATVAYGSQHDVHVFESDGNALMSGKGDKVGKYHLKTQDDVTNVQFSPDGAYLVVTTGSRRQTILYSVAEDYKELYKTTKQTGKIFSLAWSPNSQYFATGSLDGSIVVWNLQLGFGKNVEVALKDAHTKAAVQSLKWLTDDILVSASADCCIKQWNFQH